VQELALARTLFEDGIDRADEGDWSGAADRFRRAYSIKPTSGIAFNWASALIHIDRIVEASELLRGVLRDDSADAGLRAGSRDKLEEVLPRIAQLRLVVAHADDPVLQIALDGAPWPRAAWNVRSPVDPGPHELVCSRGGEEVDRASIRLENGASHDLTLCDEASLAGSGPHHSTPGERKPVYRRWELWTAVGAVVVGSVVTLAVVKRDKGAEQSMVEGNAGPGVIRW
jgi:hypothetical protein